VARLSLSKAQLARENADLAMYRRYLPSLDLKRKQLMTERNKTAQRIREIELRIAERVENIGADIPMLADQTIDLEGLARLRSVRMGEQNIVGQRLPVIEAIEVEVAPYGFLVRPHWVDVVATRLKEVILLRLEIRVAELQAELLDKAVTKVTQRVNLFDKVLIPRAASNMRRIQIALGDMERAAVVNSKIAKRKNAEVAK
jgi:V/A-type H+-transporting ATPase subunit D